MSGFHPVLGLLAVAVCISYAEGVPFSAIQKDIIANKLHKIHLHQTVPSASVNGPLPGTLYLKNNKISKRDDDSQNTNVIDERNYENINRGASFEKLKDLRSMHNDAVLANADARNGDSGDISEATQEGGGLLKGSEPSSSNEESSSGSEEGSNNLESNESNKSPLDSVLPNSGSQEDCQEDEENDSSTTSTLSSVTEGGTVEDTFTPSPTRAPNDEDDVVTPSEEECEEEGTSGAGSDASSSESSASNSQIKESQESEECDDTKVTTPTEPTQQSASTTTRDRKKPRTSPVTTQRSTSTTTPRRKKPNSEDSSASFHASDSKGVEFSGSESLESTGQSTELSD